MKTHRNWVLSICLAMMACGTTDPWSDLCMRGESVCSENGESVFTCHVDGIGWEISPCSGNTRCVDGSCQSIGDLRPICETGSTRCGEDSSIVERCNRSGTVWEAFVSCEDGKSCFQGVCLADSCSKGQKECGEATVFECNDSGQWDWYPCPDEQICILGKCLECLDDEGCTDGELCREGTCQYIEPRITTTELPSGLVGSLYEVALEASGGAPPLVWSLKSGALPNGIELKEEGIIKGTPDRAEKTEFLVTLRDDRGKIFTQEFSLDVYSEGLVSIKTKSINVAKEGRKYSFQMGAEKGTSPYGWQILEGSLPEGLILEHTGKIMGVPTEIGSFPLKIRVVDGASPPTYDSRDFTFDVRVSPLEIMGDLEFNLLLVKVVVLPPIIPFFPYSKQLAARGGVKPYTWTEENAPLGLSWIIPEWGLPEGLMMNKEGRITGRVTDVSDATTVSIPGGPELSGYFFMGKVTDSRSPAKSARAIFCIPTVPL